MLEEFYNFIRNLEATLGLWRITVHTQEGRMIFEMYWDVNDAPYLASYAVDVEEMRAVVDFELIYQRLVAFGIGARNDAVRAERR